MRHQVPRVFSKPPEASARLANARARRGGCVDAVECGSVAGTRRACEWRSFARGAESRTRFRAKGASSEKSKIDLEGERKSPRQSGKQRARGSQGSCPCEARALRPR